MGKSKRQRQIPTERWQQFEVLFTSPEQRQYELIRPVVLFGQPAAERGRETQTAARTLSRHAKRFLEQGMASVFPTPPTAPPARLPPELRTFLVEVKAEHPPLHLRELQLMCFVRFGRRPSRQTIKRVLAETPPHHDLDGGTHPFTPWSQPNGALPSFGYMRRDGTRSRLRCIWKRAAKRCMRP